MYVVDDTEYKAVSLRKKLSKPEKNLGIEEAECKRLAHGILQPNNPTIQGVIGACKTVSSKLDSEGADLVVMPSTNLVEPFVLNGLDRQLRGEEHEIFPVYLVDGRRSDETAFFPDVYFKWLHSGIPEDG